MGQGYTIPGYFENCLVKGDEVKENKLFGKTLFKYSRHELREAKLFGSTVLVFKNSGIYKPGSFGSRLFKVTKKGEVKEDTLFGRVVGAIPPEWIDGFELDVPTQLNTEESKDEPAGFSLDTIGVKVTFSAPAASKKEIDSFIKNGIRYHTIETIDGCGGCTESTIPEYNEVLVYYTFLTKFPTISKPELMRECDYPHYLFAKIGVNEVGKIHKELVSKGFYGKASNAEILSTYKVGEIKEVVSKFGLSIKGKKEELIKQIVSQINETVLETELGDSIQSISEYGQAWLLDHKDEYGFYTSEKEFDSLESYKDYWAMHDHHTEAKNDCLQEIKNDKESFGRYDYDTLIDILDEENDMRGITLCYLKELLIDLSGALNWANWKECRFNKKIIGECNEIYFTPHLKKQLPKYKEYYDPSMIEEAYQINLPINACSQEDFKDIAEMMFDGTLDDDTAKTYIEKLKKQLISIALRKNSGE